MPKPDEKCKQCFGTGHVEIGGDGPHPPIYERCSCVIHKDVIANVERGMPGLSKYGKIEKSGLMEKLKTNMWITAGPNFLKHVRHVMLRQPPTYFFKVVSDAELVTAWLASISLRGGEIHDADAYLISTKFMTIPDLVVPPDLVIIRMGVKVARNSAAPEVLAEAINTRFHEGKPTWVWDEPSHPLNSGHLFWSGDVARTLSHFERLQSKSSSKVSKSNTSSTATISSVSGTGSRKSLRG
tara:strand:+ start:82 stop:801 length:720 start_codon:yes stop_codon:yes gene_type:complete